MSDARHDLHRETEAARTLLAQISDIIGDDEQARADAVEGETSLNEAIDAAVQQLASDMAMIKGLNDYIEMFGKRKERLKHRMENMRTALTVAMEQAGRKSIEHPAVKLSLRPSPPSVIVTDESIIPHEYFAAQDPKLDKRKLLADLKGGINIGGATLSNGGSHLALSWS